MPNPEHTPHPLSDTDQKLVLRANELFHDLEGEGYEEDHPEIFKAEQKRWDRLCKTFIKQSDTPRTVVDIGAGTGFVGERLLPHLTGKDTFLSTDISEKMLAFCEMTLRAQNPTCQLAFQKTRDEHIDLESSSADIVCMNSVLHHVPDPQLLLLECKRILKPGGLLLIGHEPNQRFFRSTLLQLQANLLHSLHPKRIAARILKLLGLYNRLITSRQTSDPVLEKINAKLLNEGLISSPLSRHDLSQLVDVHSPTAGGIRREEGFNPLHLLDTSFDVLRIETSNYLPKCRHFGILRKIYEAFLARLFPHSGSTFTIIARRN